MASLDIAEKRLPQDGRLGLKLGDKQVDVRVSTLAHRSRRARGAAPARQGFGAARSHRARHERGDARDRGPADHGSRTASSSSPVPRAPARRRRCTRRCPGCRAATLNMMTVEDPVEYALDGVGQTQVNPKIELDFARALRAILRQDPDIIMIGEIRDLETAQIAVQASLTGHLVLATLHTNDAASAMTRLADMGVEPYLLASSLLGVLAQRLVRRLCPACRTRVAPTRGRSATAGRARPAAHASAVRARRMRRVQRHGLPRPVRRLRAHRRRRCDPPADPRSRARARTARRGGAGRHDVAAPGRGALARGRHDLARRARARLPRS